MATKLGSDEVGVAELYAGLISAWNYKDARAFAACFSKQGNAIGFDGTQMNGALQIQESLQGVFGNHPTARYVTVVREIRKLVNDVVLLRAVAGMVPPQSKQIKADVNAIQSVVAQLTDAGWKINLFQNTPAAFDGRPELGAALTKELQAAFDKDPQAIE